MFQMFSFSLPGSGRAQLRGFLIKDLLLQEVSRCILSFLSVPECQGTETRLDMLSHSPAHCGDTNGAGVGVWGLKISSKN